MHPQPPHRPDSPDLPLQSDAARAATTMSRRRLLAAGGVAAGGLLAGCGSTDLPFSSPLSSPDTTTSAAPTTAAKKADARAPLTGLPAAEADVMRRALLCKVDNEPGSSPQVGLERCDVVYEEAVEGQDTRFIAIVQSKDCPVIGPIRSARPLDAVIAKSYGQAVLVFSGAAGKILAEIEQSGVTLRVDDKHDPGFKTDRQRKGWHNLFAVPPDIYASLKPPTGPPPPQWGFSTDPLPAAAPASRLSVDFTRGKRVEWVWDGGANAWVRQRGKGADTTASGAPVAFTNFVATIVQPIATGLVDRAGNPEQDWDVTGRGTAWVARGGQVVTATWMRASAASPTRLISASGADLALAPGTTWWSLIPAGGGVSGS